MRLFRGKRSRNLVVGLTLLSALATLAAVSSQEASEAPFLNANAAAMRAMMAGMGVKPTGDVDRDFAAMMIPHHQGAIDMAKAELQYGHDEILRRIAQGIIVDQQQEIAAMRSAAAHVHQPSDAPPLHALPEGPSNEH